MLPLVVAAIAAYAAEDCTQDAPTCFITLGGVYREDCLPNFAGPTGNYIRAVNAMNNGKGFGVNAGGASPKYFYKLLWMNATYPKGKLDIGLATARVLFPQLDFVQGMGARCAGSDPDIIQMANLAKELKRIYITGRCVCPRLKRGPRFHSSLRASGGVQRTLHALRATGLRRYQHNFRQRVSLLSPPER